MEENNLLKEFIKKCDEVSELKINLDSATFERAIWTNLIMESLRYSAVYDDLIFTDDKRSEILALYKLLHPHRYKVTLETKKAEYEAQEKREGVSE